jgi:hypothetical protein
MNKKEVKTEFTQESANDFGKEITKDFELFAKNGLDKGLSGIIIIGIVRFKEGDVNGTGYPTLIEASGEDLKKSSKILKSVRKLKKNHPLENLLKDLEAKGLITQHPNISTDGEAADVQTAE